MEHDVRVRVGGVAVAVGLWVAVSSRCVCRAAEVGEGGRGVEVVRGDDELGVVGVVVEDWGAFVEGGGRLRLVRCERGEGVEGRWFVKDFHCGWVVRFCFVLFWLVFGVGEVMVGVQGGGGAWGERFLGV